MKEALLKAPLFHGNIFDTPKKSQAKINSNNK